MKRIRNTNDRLVDVIVFYPPKIYKITACGSINAIGGTIDRLNLTHSDSDDINRGTGCNFIFFINDLNILLFMI